MVVERDLPFEWIALVLQGGGALGACQAGVYEALAEAAIYPIGLLASRSVPSTARPLPESAIRGPKNVFQISLRSGRLMPKARSRLPRKMRPVPYV
jgi:hypothetical protein